MQKTIPDDAFYYFSIARHMALDGTVSIDGISATNGFHPLWLLLIAPFYLVLPQDLEIPIHLALTLGAILDTAAGFLAYKLVHLLTDHTSVAIISALVYLVNPRTVFYAISGMETPLNVCVFALFVYGYALITLRRATLRRYVFFGIAGGLLLLARTDNILLFCVIQLCATYKACREGDVKGLLISQGLTACLLAPWVLWSYCTFGTVVQSSATALPFVLRRLYDLSPDASRLNTVFASMRVLLRSDAWLIDASSTGLPPLIGLWLWVAVGIAGASLLTTESRRRRCASGLRLLAPILLACILLLVVHAAIRWYPRSWYFAPLAWVFAVLLGMLIDADNGHDPGPLWKYRSLTALLICEIFVLVGAYWWQGGLYPWQVEMYQSSLWLRDNTPQEARIGSFNAGIQAYYSDRTVINLDGVVNQDALNAIQEQKLLEYMHHMSIGYVADYDISIGPTYAPFYGGKVLLEPLHTVDCEGVPWAGSAIGIYRLLD
jgi:hypothetical protein